MLNAIYLRVGPPAPLKGVNSLGVKRICLYVRELAPL